MVNIKKLLSDPPHIDQESIYIETGLFLDNNKFIGQVYGHVVKRASDPEKEYILVYESKRDQSKHVLI